MGRSLSLSYGANLPSSLARVLSSASGYSPCPRVSVYGTVTAVPRLEVFLVGMGSTTSITRRITRSSPHVYGFRIFLETTPQPETDNQQSDCIPFRVTPSLKQAHGGAGI